MSDVAIETPVEPAPPIPPAPEAPAELEAAPGHAADAPPPSTAARSTNVEDGSGNTNDDNGARDETSTNVESAAAPAAERGLPYDVEHLGPLRRAVLDHLVDTDEPRSVAQLLSAMPPGTTRGSAESAIKREFDAGRIERVAPGTYRLAPARPFEAKPPSASPPPPPADEAVWFSALERWVVDRASWNADELGPPPDQPNNIPADIKVRFNDRLRKRQERRREAEAAAAKRTAADAELRDKLIAATGGNVIRGPGIEDVAPIKLALELVPIDRILSSIRNKTDRKMYPGNEPATSWREDRLLREIADSYFRSIIQPRLVAAWSAAGRAPAPTAQSSPPAGLMPDDIDELRSHHDSASAPPGPHVMPQPDAALAMPPEAAGASEAPGATQEAPEAENASTVPRENGSALPDDGAAEPAPAPPPDEAAVGPVVPAPSPDAKPAVPDGRAAVLAAFKRNGTSLQPAAPQPRPAVHQAERPPERQAEPSISREGWEELVSGFVAGNVNWNTRRLGAPPGSPDCRAPRDLLRSFGL